jgi:peptidoglycan/xylan/chitin deacetylase (PgdA/CDA1 family)
VSGRLVAHAAAVLEVARDLGAGRYPPFVRGGELPAGHVPVFVFHSLEPVSFERRLRFLADNGYRTLGADEHRDVIAQRSPAPEKAVVLTIDDGRGSVWSVAAPLLARFGMTAVVFLVPGRMRERPGAPLPDLDQPDADTALVAGRDDGEHGLLYWEEVETLSRRGLDFQSHTLSHARVHTGPRLAGFVTPRDRRGYAAFDVPLLHDGDGGNLPPPSVPLGTPVFESAPRMSSARRFLEPVACRRLCTELAAAGGGPGFFEDPAWERLLRDAFAGESPLGGGWEDEARRELELRRELAEARRLVESRTGRPVRHLCYPWHASSPDAERWALEEGYETAYAGKVAAGPITLPGGDLRAIARVSEDFLETLPGVGRVPLAAVLRRKLLRRFGGRSGA